MRKLILIIFLFISFFLQGQGTRTIYYYNSGSGIAYNSIILNVTDPGEFNFFNVDFSNYDTKEESVSPVSIDWGDGSPVEITIIDYGTITSTHSYSDGTFNVKLTFPDGSDASTVVYFSLTGNFLNISNNSIMKRISSNSGNITSIIFQNDPSLKEIYVSSTNATIAIMQNDPLLQEVDLSFNLISSLSFSGLNTLKEIWVQHNNLSEQAITDMITSMTDRTSKPTGYYTIVGQNDPYPGSLTIDQVDALTAKNWDAPK